MIEGVCNRLHICNNWKYKARIRTYADFCVLHPTLSKIVQCIKWKSSWKLQGKFQKLKKRYGGQHLWARWYFRTIPEQINIKDVQKNNTFKSLLFIPLSKCISDLPASSREITHSSTKMSLPLSFPKIGVRNAHEVTVVWVFCSYWQIFYACVLNIVIWTMS